MLLNLRDISLRFTDLPVLDEVDLTIEAGERVCLVGRNGAGKSTLMKVIAGDLQPDDGEIIHSDTLRISRLIQEVPNDMHGPVFDIVASGLGRIGALLLEQISAVDDHARQAHLLHELEALGAADARTRVATTLSRMKLDGEKRFEDLSGGLKRRVLLAQALVSEPDLLLLDEPTNHLDIEGVAWLENFLLAANCAQVFISHDRAFVDRLATRIVEVDRGKLYSWPGRYAEYRRNKAEALQLEIESNREFDKQLAKEEEWIRRGVKARTKRNMGRVRQLEQMREQVAARRKYGKRAEMRAQFGEASSKRVIEAHKVTASIAGQPIVTNFSLKIQRGMCIGVMGPNGCGKSSLLRLLLGEIAPEQGSLKYGENLQIAYFDQGRSQLDLERTAAWNVADGAERIEFEGKDMHILGYLKAFLFTPERAQTAVKLLSGGERNRLLLARLFSQPSNVLVLDEPTNDLDVETLELLENLVNNYPGTVILVSHDRAFVNAVVDGLLTYQPGHGFDYTVGNYEDWQRQDAINRQPVAAAKKAAPKPAQASGSRKLSYRDQRELDSLPEAIEALENDIEAFHQQMAAPEFYQQDAEVIKEAQIQMAELQKQHDALFERWQELEAMQARLRDS